MRKSQFDISDNINVEATKLNVKKTGLPLAAAILLLTINNSEAGNQKFGGKELQQEFISLNKQSDAEFNNGIHLENDNKYNLDENFKDEVNDSIPDFICKGAVFAPEQREIRKLFRKTNARKTYRENIGKESKNYAFDGSTLNEIKDRATTYTAKLTLCVDEGFLNTHLDGSVNSSKANTFISNTLSRINTKETARSTAGANNKYDASMCEITVIPDQATNIASMIYLNDLLYDINGDPLGEKSGLFFSHRFPGAAYTLYVLPNQSLMNNVDGIAGMYSPTHTGTPALPLGHEVTGHIPGNQYSNNGSDPGHNGDTGSFMHAMPTVDVIKSSDVTSRNAVDPTTFFNGSCGTLLPIELASFIIDNDDCKIVKVRRTTESEKNNKEFILQISADGINRKTITTKAGAGDSNKELNYEYEIPMEELKKQSLGQLGINYFRLGDIDYSGKVHFHNTESLDLSECSDQTVLIYPNLIKTNGGIITIKNIPNYSDGQTQLSIIDQSGKIIQDETLDGELNESTLTLPKLSAGIYFIRIWTGGLYMDKKIIVQ